MARMQKSLPKRPTSDQQVAKTRLKVFEKGEHMQKFPKSRVFFQRRHIVRQNGASVNGASVNGARVKRARRLFQSETTFQAHIWHG